MGADNTVADHYTKLRPRRRVLDVKRGVDEQSISRGKDHKS